MDNDIPIMPPPGGSFQDPGNQQDLFAAAPPSNDCAVLSAEAEARPDGTEESGASLPLPPDTGSGADAAPLLTNDPRSGHSEQKSPLVFSDGHPLPSRDGGRDPAPAREKKPLSPVRRGTVHLSPGDFSADAPFGDLLAQARKQAGFSEEQVRQITKLNANYLVALEHSDMANLPPPVYVSAYIRTLSNLYGLDEESAALVREKLDAGPGTGDVPSTLIQNLEKEGVINEQEDRRIRKIFWSSVALLVFLLLLFIGAVVVMLRPRSESAGEKTPAVAAAVENPSGKTETGEPEGMKEPAGKPEFTRAEFDALTMPQVPEASTLQMSRKRAVVPQ